jgi:hypothetical protein
MEMVLFLWVRSDSRKLEFGWQGIVLIEDHSTKENVFSSYFCI